MTLHNRTERYITLDTSPTVKFSENEPEIPVFQIVFSRISGQEFICVRKQIDENGEKKLIFRDFYVNQNPRNDDDLKINNGKPSVAIVIAICSPAPSIVIILSKVLLEQVMSSQ